MLVVLTWTSIVLAVASFGLGAFVLYRGEPISGALNYKSDKRELQGSDFGIFFVAALLFLAVAIALVVYQVQRSDNGATSGAATRNSQFGNSSSTGAATRSTDSAATSAPSSHVTSRMGMSFLNSYLASVAAGHHTPEDLSHWYAVPVDFYASHDVTNLEVISRAYAPKEPSKRTVYKPPALVSFDRQGARYILNVKVNFVRANGQQGVTYVTYLLQRAETGEPFRIRAVSEESG